MKFAHISDIHLADKLSFSSKYSKLIRKVRWDSFEKILKDNQDKDFLLISGDLYERDFFTLKDYQKLFDLFRDFKKDIYYICGNHDYIDSKNEIFFLDIPPNLHIFSSERIEFFEQKNIRFYGISYKDRIFDKRFNYNINLNHDYFNIFLGHGEFDQINSSYMNLDLEKIKEMGFDYVGLGHIHKRKSFSDKIFYVGSIEPSSFKDKSEFGYNIFEDGRVKFINSSQMTFKELDLDLNDYKNYQDFEIYLDKILDKKYNFLTLNLSNYDKIFINEKKLKDKLNLSYLKIKFLKNKDYYFNMAKIYNNTLLSDFYKSIKDLDMDDDINKRCLEIGFDAILRSKNE
ncbi:Ser/Thr phosphatase family protein [Anaerococcus hydrogenalis ACS-025-V-Sch4]|uniref:Ser/Thr phosphatase family protein n=2 Tax=Anaerococcus hydrogenalis TaxID=33029 RepID=F0GZM7_9FIRM|nr:DNA repair exonuclease [Anaerococcus hydrogenalis]EGC84531.1 Ser/Thr phosphatase family protein [Anaerococcus hydrogenalis ACS-025-V-Sch4]